MDYILNSHQDILGIFARVALRYLYTLHFLKVLCEFKTNSIFSVSAPRRKLFFTDYGTVAKVERCNMDGSNRTRIVEHKTEQPTAVTLDLVKKLVYWADAYLDYIEVVDYNGKNRQTIIQGDLVRIFLLYLMLIFFIC